MIHEILIDAGPFAKITAGLKSHIMQKDTDAQYQVGDFLALNEIEDVPGYEDAINYTGRCCLVEVVNISRCSERYLQPGTIVLNIRPCSIVTYDAMKFQHGRDFYEVDVYGDGKGRE